MSNDVPKKKEIIKILLAMADSNLSELAELMGKTKQKLNYHFQKEDITADLFEEIIGAIKSDPSKFSKFIKAGIVADRSNQQIIGEITSQGEMILANINNGKRLHAEEHHHHNSEGYKEAYYLLKDQHDRLLIEVASLKKEIDVLRNKSLKKKRA